MPKQAARQPADHKPKKSSAERLREEAERIPGIEGMAGVELTVSGRHGSVTITPLANPMDWDADVFTFLREGDYLSAICGVVTEQDAAALRAVKPSIGSIMAALMEPDEETSEPPVGESPASQAS
jgi:hypothetical protein